jgi:Guanylate-binding protein, N-terminal domain
MTVGHQRTTQTRGVWLWSKQVPVEPAATAATAATLAAAHSNSSGSAVGRNLTQATGSNANSQNQQEEPLSLLFFDTEGFESTGQSGAYDDRIFAFAAVISSTLVYNLAEAVRESDIEKLSFAVELATAFYPRYEAPGQCVLHLCVCFC